MKFKISITAIRVAEGHKIPKWYGVAHFDFNTLCAICYPIPINLVVRLWKVHLFPWLNGSKFGKSDDDLNLYTLGYKKGYGVGLDESKKKDDETISVLESQVAMYEATISEYRDIFVELEKMALRNHENP